MVAQESDPSVLLNGHFDSPPGSPGAADCGSCVGGFMLYFISIFIFLLINLLLGPFSLSVMVQNHGCGMNFKTFKKQIYITFL